MPIPASEFTLKLRKMLHGDGPTASTGLHKRISPANGPPISIAIRLKLSPSSSDIILHLPSFISIPIIEEYLVHEA
jgi:hypothetical protein